MILWSPQGENYHLVGLGKGRRLRKHELKPGYNCWLIGVWSCQILGYLVEFNCWFPNSLLSDVLELDRADVNRRTGHASEPNQEQRQCGSLVLQARSWLPLLDRSHCGPLGLAFSAFFLPNFLLPPFRHELMQSETLTAKLSRCWHSDHRHPNFKKQEPN